MYENSRALSLKITFVALCFMCGSFIYIFSIDVYSFAKVSGRLLIGLGNLRDALYENSTDVSFTLINQQAELQRRLKNATENKFLLLWHRPTWFTGKRKFNQEVCGKCELTLDKSKINDTRTAAVVFHYHLVRENNMPAGNTRNVDQLHIFWQSEPTTHIISRMQIVNSTYKFNATMSYRRASDFYETYHVTPIARAKRRNASKSTIIKMKNKLAMSMISNCGSNPGAKARIKIIRRLQDLDLAIDGYGRCFKNMSLKKGINVKKIISQYKFFMSFENSYHCRDYITEKAYRNGIESLAVPVVWGATKEDYAAFLPKGSYIFAEDFKTLESLVEFLKYLDSNDTAYLSYFDWYQRELPPENRPGVDMYCQLCRAVHGVNYDDRHRPDYDPLNPKIPTFTNAIAKRNIPSLKSYVLGEENPECVADNAENWSFYKKWKL